MKSHSDVGKAGYPTGLSLATYGMFIGSIAQSMQSVKLCFKGNISINEFIFWPMYENYVRHD